MEDPERLLEDADAALKMNPQEVEAERQRRAEEAMEQLLRAQEEEEEQQASNNINNDGPPQQNDYEIFGGENDPEDQQHHANGGQEDEQNDNNAAAGMIPPPLAPLVVDQQKPNPFSYIRTSFLVAFGMIFYALRSRQQWYLALVYLSSSKWAYIVLGNALIAFLIWIFQVFTRLFLNGLRLAEAEGLGDFFRWNITETCLALTMFRSELNVQTGILFLILVLAKCLHWVADMREGHLRMTEESIVVRHNSRWPALRWSHFRLLLCLLFLQFLDVLAVIQCGHDILTHGPSVSILFAFEGAILLVSVMSNILLWTLHLLDGMFHYWHETTDPASFLHRWIHPWKDHKATLVFAVEVQAQAAKFLFYVTFFAIVMTYYGMPINLFREVYLSFQSLKQRLVAFAKYRQLMANMNRFANPSAEELEEEPTCIICRDEMTVETTKRLPGCGHLFHKSCLREWLVQQQSCPTCRGDISAMEARQRQQDQLVVIRREEQAEEETEAPAPEQDGNQRDDVETLSSAQNAKQQNEATQVAGVVGSAESNHVASQKFEPARLKDPPQVAFAATAAFTESQRQRRSIMKEPPRSLSSSSSSLEDKKLPATNPVREKRVRIVSPGPPDLRNGDEGAAFPAFYRVVQDQGAPVYNNGESVTFVIRIVPFGLVVLGSELSWRDCDGEGRLMVRIPDGWVCDDDLERIVAVPLQRSN